MLKLVKFLLGIIIKPTTTDSAGDSNKAKEGALWVSDTAGENRFKTYLNSSDHEITTNDQTQVFLNKKFGDSTEFQNTDNIVTDDYDTGSLIVKGGVSISKDVQILGELHANGLVLDTKDPNITLNKGGAAVDDDTAGITIDLSTTDAEIIYDSSLSSKFKVGLNGDLKEVTTVSDSQDLSNKTMLDELTFTEIASPSNPVATEHKLYPKSDGKFYTLNSIGDEVPLGSGGITKVSLYDSVSTALPTGLSVIVDGVTAVDGDQVLFSNLLVDSDRIYELSGVGVALVWTAKANFANGVDPINGDMVIVQQGTAFSQQVGIFDGTDWSYNENVRYFNGTDYYEVSSLNASTISNNTTGNIFSVAYAGSENMVIDYSITRGSSSETGQLYLTTDGTDVSLAQTVANIGASGVELSGLINGSDVELNYISDNSVDGTIKYIIKRWSNGSGGPAGVPSYSGAGGSSTPAAGVIQDIQIHGSDGNLGADADFKVDSTEGQLNLAGLKIQKLSSDITVNDNQAAFTPLFSYPLSEKFTIVEYSIERGTNVRVGRLMIPSNGVLINHSDDFSETATTGVSLTVAVNGANIEVQYLSTSTGLSGTFKYSLRKW